MFFFFWRVGIHPVCVITYKSIPPIKTPKGARKGMLILKEGKKPSVE